MIRRPSVLVIALALLEVELLRGPVQWAPLRVAVGLPLALGLPGFLLQRALLPPKHRGPADVLLTSLALSLCVLAVGGVLLNAASVDIAALSWLVYITAVAVAADLAAFVRKQPSPAVDLRLSQLSPRYFATGVALLLLVGAAFGISITAANHQATPGFSQFWLVPRSDGRTGYELGILNHTERDESYSVQLRVGGHVVRDWGPVALSSDRRWQATVALPRHASVEALLFRDDARTPYRRVFIRDA